MKYAILEVSKLSKLTIICELILFYTIIIIIFSSEFQILSSNSLKYLYLIRFTSSINLIAKHFSIIR